MGKNFIFYLILLILTIASCGKKELGVNLLGDLKNENPYTGNEKLIFLDQNNDSIIFNGEGRYNEEYEYSNSTTNGYYINERDNCYFVSVDNKYYIDVYMSSYLSDTKNMAILLTSYGSKNLDSCRSITNYYDLPLYEYYNSGSVRFLDSIVVRDKNYYNVYVDSSMTHQWDGCNELNYAERLFYSTQYGILKIDFSDGDTWELADLSGFKNLTGLY